MKMTAVATIKMAGRDVTAFGGPSSWPDVPVGIYFSHRDITEIFGRPVVPELWAVRPDGKAMGMASGWTLTRSLCTAGREQDWRVAMLAVREADEAFGNAPQGYEWLDLIWVGPEE